MPDERGLRAIIKRGGLITLANWPVLIVQFIAESIFKILLGVPVAGGLFLVGLAVGQDITGLLASLFAGDFREVVTATLSALATQPAGLAAFVISLVIVTLGGAALTFVVKAGTVSVLADGERAAGPIERPPLRWSQWLEARRFTPDAFLDGCRRLGVRYVKLGVILLGFYLGLGVAYLAVIYSGYHLLPNTPALWSLVAFFASCALVLLITVANFAYLLLQMIIAFDDVGLRSAARRTVQYLRHDTKRVVAVFLIVLSLVLVSTMASFVATGALGLISFVPLVGLAVFPIQAVAWLLRGLFFQYLGLTGLGAYLALYRGEAR
jgi:hypothetical protein